MVNQVNRILWIDSAVSDAASAGNWDELEQSISRRIDRKTLSLPGTGMVVLAVQLANDAMLSMSQWINKPAAAMLSLKKMMDELIGRLSDLENSWADVDLLQDLDKAPREFLSDDCRTAVQRFFMSVTGKRSLITLLKENKLISYLKQIQKISFDSPSADVFAGWDDLKLWFDCLKLPFCTNDRNDNVYRAHALLNKMTQMTPVPSSSIQYLNYLLSEAPDVVDRRVENHELVDILAYAQEIRWRADPCYGFADGGDEEEE